MDELLTAAELAGRLRVKPGTVSAWTRAGRIPAVRIGPKTIRFDWAGVVKALREQQQAGGEKGQQ